jgi:hypothetical protein
MTIGRSRSDSDGAGWRGATHRRKRRGSVPLLYLGLLAIVGLTSGSVQGSESLLPSLGRGPAHTADGGSGRSYAGPPVISDGAAVARATAQQLAETVTAVAASSASSPTSTSASGGSESVLAVPLTLSSLGIPAPALAAYQAAASEIDAEQPSCHLTWPVLAGIGKVESGNAAGRYIAPDGTVTPTIVGPRLDGSNGTARIADTDGGQMDGDTVFDRAVGPMQFIPSTWRWAGRSAAGTGKGSPNNIRDAALAAAGYLCRTGDLSMPARLAAAIHSYNPSDTYVRAVLGWAAGYAQAQPAVVQQVSAKGIGPATYTPGKAPRTTAVKPPPAVTVPPAAPSVVTATTSPTATPAPSARLTPTPTTSIPPIPPGSPAPAPSPSATCQAVTPTASSILTAGVDTDPTTAGLDALDVTGQLTGTGPVTVTVGLSDPAGLPIASTTGPVTPQAGPVLLARLPGFAIGDAGVSGILTLTITLTPAAGCPPPPPTTAATGNIDATTFTGWATTLTRLTARLSELHTTGDVDTPTDTALASLIPVTVTTSTALNPFQAALTNAGQTGGADPLAVTRLTSLAERLPPHAPAAAAAPSPTPTSTPPRLTSGFHN